METPETPTSIEHRIREGLARLAIVLRADDWMRAKISGVNPTQQAILDFLEARPGGTGLNEIAGHLGVSQPTATDSVAALERKGYLARRTRDADKRGLIVSLTEAGRAALAESLPVAGKAEAALERLEDTEKQQFLVTIVKLIKNMHELDAIPIQRMCATCRYFSPFAHQGERPHHCHFVDAAFGQRDLRIDCRDHETADPPSRAATWDAFDRG
jgi:DNA-binding MarR family transcriptional regulator